MLTMSHLSNILFHSKDQTLFAVIPDKQLLNQSLHLKVPEKPLSGWSAQNHADSCRFMQQIAQAWKNSHVTDQYLIYGKVDSNPFHWEIVPYQKCRTWIGRAIQQIQVLWRTVFGGVTVSEKESQNQYKKYEWCLSQSPDTVEPSDVPNKSHDTFCKDETIERQWVVTGKKVNVLFNYAPVGFGGERLHFLVVPKQHRETFTDVTQEEYCESLELASKLIDHFTETRKLKNVYLLNKTGRDAGQIIKHWHLHVIFSTNNAQDFWGKMTIFKSILLGYSPMKKDDLAKKVGGLREELAYID